MEARAVNKVSPNCLPKKPAVIAHRAQASDICDYHASVCGVIDIWGDSGREEGGQASPSFLLFMESILQRWTFFLQLPLESPELGGMKASNQT